ncbi:transposase family protein [Nonomuraea sp. NPDC049486]|uniref:transposase family protein n=1 Tax=Nonomuraea sp. NPDC049486 TaxID=3155773 RepID=UPI0034444BD3
MSITELLAVVFPHLAAVRVERVHRIGVTVQVKAATTEPKGECPACGWESVRVHSRYERCLPDLPVAGQEVLGQVQVRRFFCDNTAWAKRTFAEQVPGLTSRHGGRVVPLPSMLRVVAPALGGRPGARWRGQAATIRIPHPIGMVTDRPKGTQSRRGTSTSVPRSMYVKAPTDICVPERIPRLFA